MNRLNRSSRKLIKLIDSIGKFKIEASGGMAILMVICTFFVVITGCAKALLHVIQLFQN